MGFAELTIEDALYHIFDFQNINSNSYFDTLQIDQVKKAFRRKVKMYHPDKAAFVGEDEHCLTLKFKQLHESYDLLLSLIKKREIEKQLTGLRRDYPKMPRKNSTSRPNKQPVGGDEANAGPEKKKRQHQRKWESVPEFKTFYYQGAVPARQLRFAEYLFYTGCIDWMTLIDSLVWQSRIRPRIGDLARSLGFLDINNVGLILKNGKFNERFGETAIRIGILTEQELQKVLMKQKQYNLPIGTYFIRHNIFDNQILFKKIVENKVHNFKYKEKSL